VTDQREPVLRVEVDDHDPSRGKVYTERGLSVEWQQDTTLTAVLGGPFPRVASIRYPTPGGISIEEAKDFACALVEAIRRAKGGG
jgi:hypothetical protein